MILREWGFKMVEFGRFFIKSIILSENVQNNILISIYWISVVSVNEWDIDF